MSESVLLISVNRCATPHPVFPLGVAHVAAALKGAGYRVTILDMAFNGDTLADVVKQTAPRFIGISLRNIDDHRIDDTLFFVPDLFAVTTQVRALTDAPIVIGGSAFSLFPETLLEKSGADYGIVGEGEASLPQLFALLAAEKTPAPVRLAAIPGLVYKRGTTVIVNLRRPLDPRSIVPALRQPQLSGYYQSTSGVANVQTQRGCPYACCYCTYPLIEGKALRLRDPEAVADEIEAIVATGARYLFFVDSVFNADNDHVHSICETLLRRNIAIEWGCFLRPKGLTPDLMALLARAGLRHVEFGTDSFCDTVLEAYGKDFSVDEVIAADHCADAAGIRHAHFLICGGPGETEATLEASFQTSLALRKTVIFPFVGMRLYPATALWHKAVAQKVIDESTDLLSPFFYITPAVEKERIVTVLDDFHRRSARWIVRDPTPEQRRVMELLHRKKIAGPLWEFLAQ